MADDVYALGRWWGVLVYLIVGRPTMLVDTGPAGHAPKILDAVLRAGVDPAGIERIVLTHYDYDHSGSAADLALQLNAPVAVHAADAPLLARPAASPGLRRWLYHPPIPRLLRWTPLTPDETLEDGDALGGWRVMHTPGHTPGSLSLLRGETCIVGDALVYGNGRLRQNVAHLAMDLDVQRASARRLARSGAQVVLPGHYAPCTDPAAMRGLRRTLGV